MQQQKPQGQLQTWIQATYQGKSTSQILSAQNNIMNRLESDPTIIKQLFQYLKSNDISIDLKFKKACSNFIKKFYYQAAQSHTLDKDAYLQMAYEVLADGGSTDTAVKENVGVAVENIFNKDDKLQYKPKWAQHVKNQLYALIENPEAWTAQTLEVIHGLVIILIALYNSLVQPEDQIQFINQILKSLCKVATLCRQFLHNPQSDSQHLKAPLKIFQLLSISTQRLLQQYQLYPQQISQILQNQQIKNIQLQYLHMHMSSQGQSILTKSNKLNQIKSIILDTLYAVACNQFTIDLALMTIFFQTFVAECGRWGFQEDDDFGERLLGRVIGVLEKQLGCRIHQAFFQGLKVQILFALLSYCRTGPQQLQDMIIEPTKFADFAEQFSQSFPASQLIKIRAANFLKTYVKMIDEALANILELCVIFITGSLKQSQSDSQVLKLAKQSYSQFGFMNYTARDKLDVSFMVLTVLSQQLNKRSDIKAILTSILMTNSRVLQQITDQLVLARLIRLIGYYPNSLYFNFIQRLMYIQKVFLIQGLRMFDRIARNKLYLEAFPLMHLVFIGLVQILEVGEPIFQHLIYQNANTVLRKNMELYSGVVQKICQCFCEVVTNMQVNSCKQKAIQCLNYIDKLMQTQKQQGYLQVLQQNYLKMQQIGITHKQLQDNYISIYQTLISKTLIIPNKLHNIILYLSNPTKLSSYSNYSEYFKLVNKYVLKSQNQVVLKQLYQNFMEFLGQTQLEGQGSFNFGIVPQLCYDMGHILLSVHAIQHNFAFVQFIANLVIKKQQVRGHFTYNQHWYLFLLLHYLYQNPKTIRQFLISKKLNSSLMIALLTSKCTTKIERKVCVLAAQQILTCQQDLKLRLQIIKYCIRILNNQKQIYFIKKSNNRQNIASRISRRNGGGQGERSAENQMDMEREDVREEEECMDNREGKNNNNDEDVTLFKGFKHPLDKVCQFSMFRQRILSFYGSNQISQQNLPGLTQIVHYQWHKQSIRKVFRPIK